MFVSQVAFNGSGLEVMQCMQCFFNKRRLRLSFEASVDPEVQFERRMRRHEGQLE